MSAKAKTKKKGAGVRIPNVPEEAGVERPFVVSLSHGELAAVLRYHLAEAKAVTRRTGSIGFDDIFRGGRELKMLFDVGKEKIRHHHARARELADIFEKHVFEKRDTTAATS